MNGFSALASGKEIVLDTSLAALNILAPAGQSRVSLISRGFGFQRDDRAARILFDSPL